MDVQNEVDKCLKKNTNKLICACFGLITVFDKPSMGLDF